MLVDRIWFENHQWHKFIDDTTHLGYNIEEGNYGTSSFKMARWDHIGPTEDGSEYYQFFACGNGFQVECKISDNSYEEEVILNALKVVGLKMIDTSKEWIICAAIWYQDGTEAPRGMIAQNIKSGVVIGQWRHGNCINVRATNPLWNAKKLVEIHGECPVKIERYEDTLKYFDSVDGFLTSKGNFVDRWQAAKIALECGQITEEKAIRTSERSDDDISDEELMKTEPQYRQGHMRGKYRMMYSEDFY